MICLRKMRPITKGACALFIIIIPVLHRPRLPFFYYYKTPGVIRKKGRIELERMMSGRSLVDGKCCDKSRHARAHPATRSPTDPTFFSSFSPDWAVENLLMFLLFIYCSIPSASPIKAVRAQQRGPRPRDIWTITFLEQITIFPHTLHISSTLTPPFNIKHKSSTWMHESTNVHHVILSFFFQKEWKSFKMLLQFFNPCHLAYLPRLFPIINTLIVAFF